MLYIYEYNSHTKKNTNGWTHTVLNVTDLRGGFG